VSSRAGGRETLTLTANASSDADATTQRVQRFVDRYRALHEQFVGVAYLGNPQKDYQAACELVAAFDDGMLEAIATYGLNDADAFMANGTRTMTKLKSRASDYAQLLKARKLA
jgi:2',3'-cyclic-nucleotide 2'-phosphodiesterase (5'-nucleotidase family)